MFEYELLLGVVLSHTISTCAKLFGRPIYLSTFPHTKLGGLLLTDATYFSGFIEASNSVRINLCNFCTKSI